MEFHLSSIIIIILLKITASFARIPADSRRTLHQTRGKTMPRINTNFITEVARVPNFRGHYKPRHNTRHILAFQLISKHTTSHSIRRASRRFFSLSSVCPHYSSRLSGRMFCGLINHDFEEESDEISSDFSRESSEYEKNIFFEKRDERTKIAFDPTIGTKSLQNNMKGQTINLNGVKNSENKANMRRMPPPVMEYEDDFEHDISFDGMDPYFGVSIETENNIEKNDVRETVSKQPFGKDVATFLKDNGLSSKLKDNDDETDELQVENDKKQSLIRQYNNSSPLTENVEQLISQPPPIIPTIRDQSVDEQTSFEFLKAASTGNGASSNLEALQFDLSECERALMENANSGKEKFVRINFNSQKQVSTLLFGVPNESTGKEILEPLITHGSQRGQLADLILKCRKLSKAIQKLEKEERKIELKEDKDKTFVHKAINKGERDPLLLVDSSAYIYRAYHSMPPLHRYDGMPIGAILGFCNMLNRLFLHRLLRGENPRIVLVYDSKNGTNFRKEMYSEYKANRPPCPEDLVPQFDMARYAADAYGVTRVEAENFEADDVIATLATMAVAEGCNVDILSGDKDLMQLITEDENEDTDRGTINMVDPMTMKRITHIEVKEKWGVSPSKVGDVLALAGDRSDNIPGVPGIGPKIAANLLDQFGSLEQIIHSVDDIKQEGRRNKLKSNIDMAKLSRNLVELERFIPIEKMSSTSNFSSIRELRVSDLDEKRLLSFYDEHGMHNLKRRIEDRINSANRQMKNTKSQIDRKHNVDLKEDYLNDIPF